VAVPVAPADGAGAGAGPLLPFPAKVAVVVGRELDGVSEQVGAARSCAMHAWFFAEMQPVHVRCMHGFRWDAARSMAVSVAGSVGLKSISLLRGVC
jgi:hypothetical protein